LPSPDETEWARSPADALELVTAQGRARLASRKRRNRFAVAGGAAAVLVAFVVIGLALRPDRRHDRVAVSTRPAGSSLRDVPAPTFTRPPQDGAEQWTPVASSPLSGRANAFTAWTGKEMLVFRGDGALSDGGGGEPSRVDGAAYDPTTNRWRKLAKSPFEPTSPNGGYGSIAAVWTGKQMIVWRGLDQKAAAYTYATDTWQELDAGPLSQRRSFAVTWTGREMIVYGGNEVGGPTPEEPERSTLAVDDGAAYDPVTGTWRRIAPSGVPRSLPFVAWDGKELLAVGGSDGGRGGKASALAYDPAADRWRELAAPPFHTPTSMVWTGRLLVAVSRPSGQVDTRGPVHTYDPVADRWAEVTDPPAVPKTKYSRGDPTLAAWYQPTLVWDGQEVLVFGSMMEGHEEHNQLAGFAWSPTTKRWRTLPASGLSSRSGPSAVWTGSELLLWGGSSSTGFTTEPYADGARYRPGAGR
jgi:hypothetical protein